VHRTRLGPVLVATIAGCGWNYTPSDNLLPDPNAEGSEDEGPPPPETGDTGGLEELPATYRFDCVDIQSLGDADKEVFQVATLQSTWAADISGFRLNILFDLLSEDTDTNEATIAIRSGIGTGWTDQCSEPTSESSEHAATIEPMVGEWEPATTDELCAEMNADASATATYDVQLAADEFVYIYAEANDGTYFNCKVGGGAPNAIPIAGIEAQITMTEDRSALAGTLTGCMSASEALTICSCLGVCQGDVHPDCEGCPGGAVPLGLLLGGINPTQHCSDLMGEDAFDIVLQFSARRLAEVPPTCG
jgi:hypothetical protein